MGAVACLEPKDKIDYESALAEGRMEHDVERILILEKYYRSASKALSASGARLGRPACIRFALESPVCAFQRPHGARARLKGEITGEIR